MRRSDYQSQDIFYCMYCINKELLQSNIIISTMSLKSDQSRSALDPPPFNTMTQRHYNSNNNKQMKMIKVEEIAARINKFKNIIKEATGRISTGNAGASHPTVRIDASNSDDRICQENKLMFTTSSSTMEKKIAEYKQTKLSRPYGEILHNNYNQGLQPPVSGKKENNVISFNTSSSSKVIQGVMEANTPKTTQFNKLFPSHMLRQKSQVEPKITQQNSVDTSKTIQQAPKRLQNVQFRQYKKMARNDKYCEQFMQFLDDDKAFTKKSERKRPIDKLINQMIIKESKQEQKIAKEADQASDIQNRVKVAIRNSLKLINGLKQRDNQC